MKVRGLTKGYTKGGAFVMTSIKFRVPKQQMDFSKPSEGNCSMKVEIRQFSLMGGQKHLLATAVSQADRTNQLLVSSYCLSLDLLPN